MANCNTGYPTVGSGIETAVIPKSARFPAGYVIPTKKSQ